jgi:phage tail sheath gpL-like
VVTSRINQNSLAAAVGVGVENVQFVDVAETLPRKILIVAQYDKDKTDVADYELKQIRSSEEAGTLYGFGHEIHRLAIWVFRGSDGVETWVSPDPDVADNGSPTYAYGSINITASGVLAGTLHLYIAGDYVPVKVNDDDTAATIENAIVAAINADKNLPISSSSTTPTPDQVNTKSKDRGVFGNYVRITFNEGFGQEFPVGISVVAVQPAGGTGTIGFNAVFSVLGENDEQNELYFTELIHSDPDLDTGILDEISEWNGVGNNFVGNYGKLVQRPLRSLNGDITAGDSGFNNLVALGDNRKEDRTNGVVAVPGSPNHPQEIAALALGIAARINNVNAAENYVHEILPGIWPGAADDRWTSSYENRDTAVKAGISPTLREDGFVKLQNLLTFYHPDDVPSNSNGYRSMRSISVLQNITNSIKLNFRQEKWRGITIVENVDNVNDPVARLKVRDKQSVQNDIIALARLWADKSWIFTADFTIDRVSTGNYVQVRSGGTGFDIQIPVILSGETWIIDSVIQFDTALTVFTQ